MTDSTAEDIFLANYVEQLRSDGYEVVIEPSRLSLPAFLRDFRPDAIALKENDNLVVEVVTEGPSSRKKVDDLRELVSGQAGWSLRVIGLGTAPLTPIPNIVSVASIIEANNNIVTLLTAGQPRPALLLAWAAFEATARGLLPEKFRRPQTPGRLVEILANEGLISPDEAEELRNLAEQRNRLIHGGLDTLVSEQDVKNFVETLKHLASKLGKRQRVQ